MEKKALKGFKIVLVALFILSMVFLPPLNKVKADTSAIGITNSGFKFVDSDYNVDELRPASQLWNLCDSLVEPQGFEQNGGGWLYAYIPMNYIFYNDNDSKYYLFDSFKLNVDKIYENGNYYYDDIEMIFGISDSYTLGLGNIRVNGLLNNHDTFRIQTSNDFIMIQPSQQTFYWLLDLHDLSFFNGSYINYMDYYENAINLVDSEYFSQISFQSGKNEVIDNPNSYNLYSRSQYLEYGNEKYMNGLALGQSDNTTYGNIFTTLFGGFSDILNVEVFPNITIGLVVGLPILLGLFLIILKLIRG